MKLLDEDPPVGGDRHAAMRSDDDLGAGRATRAVGAGARIVSHLPAARKEWKGMFHP